MTPFLKQVAEHYFRRGDIEGCCFIFPNRRAKSFFTKWLREAVAARGDRPLSAPAMMTMNDFFYRLSGAVATDRTALLLKLYDNYRRLNPLAEPLDDFIFWGDVLLGDFNDVDKYLVNPAHIFTNVADFKNIQDSFSYLTESQREAIGRFLDHFKGAGGEKDIKARFLKIWDLLLPLYKGFRETLSASGMSYEGQVYRAVADRLDPTPVRDILEEKIPESRKFVFVGLNALNECEKKLMGKMRDAGLAEFCWDFSSDMIKDGANKSSFFLKQNIQSFPQAFRLDADGLEEPEINILSVPGEIGMAKQIPEILRRLPQGVPGLETAVVLPDEGLLMPVLNSIPEHITELNVTMGYPMAASEFWSLMNDIAALQLHLRLKDGKWYFYHRQVLSIFSNSVFKSLLGEECGKQVQAVRDGMKYYIPLEDLSGRPLLDLIFRPVVTDPSGQTPEAVKKICAYLLELVAGIGSRLCKVEDMAAETDFAREYYAAVERLGEFDLPLRPASFFRLLGQLAAGISVPFQGEPLGGLQIMGPLETRALDFENVILLSCNEGMFPRRSVSSSFIPPELRKGFGLPTYEYQDAVWAYYFYRMIQRARRVWMVFDSRADGLRGGEESRYIKQLELHFGARTTRYVVNSPILTGDAPADIPKTPEHVEALHGTNLSASSLQNYLSCPAKFFYEKVEGLREDDEVSESLDAGSLGSVFHKTMQALYEGRKSIGAKYLDSLLADEAPLRKLIAEQIKEQLHTFEIAGRNIIFLDVVCRYVVQTLRRDRELLDRYGIPAFRLLGVERTFHSTIGGFKFKGVADRIDSFADDEVRVVDYKTGKVTDDDFIINAGNAAEVVEKLFGPDNAARPKIALQLYLYDRFVSESDKASGLRRNILNSIYQPQRLFLKEVENVELDDTFKSLMDGKMEELLQEIGDISVPWHRTEDRKTCGYCDFKMICGR